VIEVDPEPYRLFRFFDFQVEPGKFYQYRVKLMLINPNYDVERQYLEQDDLRVAKYLETDWSEATEIVSVPRDARVLLGSVKPTPRGRVTMEPKASVGISFFYYDRGAQLYERHDVVRGMYLNFPGHELPANLVPVEETVPGQGLLGLGLGGPGKKTDEPEPVTVDFNTEHILLDMMGGERLPGRDRNLVSPGKMLLFDPSGNLVVKDELEDKTEYDLSDPDLKPAASNAPGGLFSDEEDYDMEEMEEEDDDYDNY
jgi:hypothetical protein